MSSDAKSASIKRAIKVLKFLLKIEDLDMIKATIEQVIDNLEEEANK